MGRMYVLDRTGHTEVAWDARDDAAARAEFGRLRTCGYVPFGKPRPTSEPQQLDRFDAELA